MNYLIVKEINWAAGDDYWGDYALISRASIPQINVNCNCKSHATVDSSINMKCNVRMQHG